MAERRILKLICWWFQERWEALTDHMITALLISVLKQQSSVNTNCESPHAPHCSPLSQLATVTHRRASPWHEIMAVSFMNLCEKLPPAPHSLQPLLTYHSFNFSLIYVCGVNIVRGCVHFFVATGAVMQSDSLETDGLTLIVRICTVCQYIHPLYRCECPEGQPQPWKGESSIFFFNVTFLTF